MKIRSRASSCWTIVSSASLLLAALVTSGPVFGQLAGKHCDADIVIMLDRTGSMSSSDLSNERTAAKTILGVAGSADTPPLIAIGAFGDNTNGGVEAFLDHALTRTLTPPPYGDDDPGPDTDGDLYNSVETVTGSNSSVGTDIADALSVANTALNGGTSGHQVVILVSDGDPNEPTNSTDAREAAYLTSDSIKLLGREIFTMHFGSDPSGFAGKELLAAIATGTAPVPSTDGHNTHGHQTGSANDQATAALENSDGDHFFISPTAADMTTVMTTILTQYCQSVPSPTPTETPTVTPTPTVTLTYTLSPIPTETPTDTPTQTAVPPTLAPTDSPTSTPPATMTASASASSTPLLATATPSASASVTPPPLNQPTATPNLCGNGDLDPGEQCDDANNVSGDCCAANCMLEAAGSVCDDGLACTTGETCDGNGICVGEPSAGQYAILHWLPAVDGTTFLGRKALLKGHVCGPVVRARRSSRVIGNLTSLMSTGTAIVLNDRVQIAGSTISAGGGIVIKKHVAVGGLTLADSTSTSSAIADCELARSQASDKYAQLSVLSPTLSLGTIKIKRAKSMRVPASGTLGDGVQVVQFDDLKLGGHTTLTFAGAPTTTHLVIRIPGKLRLMRDAKIVLDGLIPEQVIWVVDGETIIGGNARFQGTVLGTGSLSARLQSRIEGAFVGRTLKAGRTSIINRRPFVGWCD